MPDHDATSVKSATFKDTIVYIMFMYITVNSSSAVSMTNIKSELLSISKLNPFTTLEDKTMSSCGLSGPNAFCNICDGFKS